VLNKALEDADISELEDYLDDANGLLGGQVNVTIDYGYWDEQNQCYTDEGTMQFPFNLRALWNNPPANFCDWAPQTYIMLDEATYALSNGNELNMWLAHQEDDNVTGGWNYDGEWGDLTVAIGGAPHNVSIPELDAQLTFNWDWSELTGTIGGTSVTGQGIEDEWHRIWRCMNVKWDDIPDKTLGGVFPDENKLEDLVVSDYDKLNLTYGSIFLGENTLPVIITQK